MRRLFTRRQYRHHEVDPDEIFLDSSNLPNFDTDQFEGRIETPIPRSTVYIVASIFLLVAIIYIGQVFKLQFFEGSKWSKLAENNRLHHSLLFAERGVIQDRNGVLLAWNEIGKNQNGSTTEEDFASRVYRDHLGTHSLIGYVKYPRKDKSGYYYNTEYAGADGVESFFDATLKGQPGMKLTETDVQEHVISESVMRPAIKGANITLTVDARIQEYLYDSMKEIVNRSGFIGGAGMIMDVRSGEVIAAISYPGYDANIMTSATNTSAIKGYLSDSKKPFLDRIAQGLYTPGSIVKPFFALAALQEQIISPDKQIESTGELKLPNPFKPGEFSIFKDWKAHGYTDMREAIAVSSDVYFYQIGGGYLNQQKGLGILKIDEYAHQFGLGGAVTSGFFKGKAGIIPTPEWKEKNFNGDIWRVGDTYNTVIGQYGFQVTPAQVIRAVSALANKGILYDPYIFKSMEQGGEFGANRAPSQVSAIRKDIENTVVKKVEISNPEYYRIVQEGMRMTVTEGTMQALNVPYVKIAGKTGTAQVGVNNQFINSWTTGFFPYESPKYAFVVMMERGPSDAIYGGTAAMALLIEKMNLYAPEYFKVD
jgi:penicillin-binding protein 2